MHPERRRADEQRGADVVPVADVDELQAVEPAAAFADRHQVGEDLARVRGIGQRVHDRDRRVPSQFFDVVLRERADHERVDVPREDGGGVADRLTACELQFFAGEGKRGASELRDARGEGDPRPRRGLEEEQRDRAPGEALLLAAVAPGLLELVREVENRLQLGPLPVGELREAPPLQAVGGSGHRRILCAALGVTWPGSGA